MKRYFRVTWEHEEVELYSTGEVESLLDRLHEEFRAGQGTLVVVELSDTEDSLAIGLGRDLSVLNYVRGSKDPPYFTSTSDDECSEQLTTFRFMDDLSEFPSRNLIPVAAAREAMRSFCLTSQLPASVRWEED